MKRHCVREWFCHLCVYDWDGPPICPFCGFGASGRGKDFIYAENNRNANSDDAMSNDQLQLRGLISTLPEPEQKEIHSKAEEIREVIRSSKVGLMAMALVGMEIQDESE